MSASESSNASAAAAPAAVEAYEWGKKVPEVGRGNDGLSAIATPLAGKKLLKKSLQLITEAAKAKKIKRGVKEVLKAVRKHEKGLMLIAGNISPIDVIAHIPILCEENEIPYLYLSSKEAMGGAAATKRPCSVVLIQTPASSAEYTELYQKVRDEIAEVTPSYQ